MKFKVCMIAALLAFFGLLLPSFSDGLVATTVALPSSGVVKQTSEGSYSYTMDILGSNYRILNSASTVVYTSTSSSAAFNRMINLCSNGNNLNIATGTYNIDASWTIQSLNDITVNFQSGTILNAKNNLNNPIIWLKNVDNCAISGGTFNGNAANQILGTNYVQGIQLDSCTNCLINNVHITNVRRFGVLIQGPNTDNCGITNSKIDNCWWNGINLGGDLAPESNLYAKYNEVSYCSDVGITSYGINDVIAENYVHDMIERGDSGHPGYDSSWAIANEQGGGSGSGSYNLVKNNIINTAKNGVVITRSGAGNLNYVLVSGNNITNCNQNGVVLGDSSYSIVEFNSIKNAYCGVLIYTISGTCISNTVYNNTYTTCSVNIQNGGSGTIFTAPPY
jgi:hypothetical protein